MTVEAINGEKTEVLQRGMVKDTREQISWVKLCCMKQNSTMSSVTSWAMKKLDR